MNDDPIILWRRPKRSRIAVGVLSAGVLVLTVTQAITHRVASPEPSASPIPTYSAAALEVDMADQGYDYRDITCATTSKTLPNGDGWYVCSWRTAGDPESVVYTVEVGAIDLDWSTDGLGGPVSRFTAEQRDLILTDPLNDSLWEN